MSAGAVHGGMPTGAQQQMMWSEGANPGYGAAPVGLAAWVDAHAYPVPPPPNENDMGEQDLSPAAPGGAPITKKVEALEVENCEMAGKMAAMEALLRERDEDSEPPVAMRKVAALEVENCEMAGKMAGMEALLREREMEHNDMKQTLLAYEHVLEGERRGEPLSKAELLKQVIALSAQLQELSKNKTATSAAQEEAPIAPPPGAAAASSAPTQAAPAPQARGINSEKVLPGQGNSPFYQEDPGAPPAGDFETSDNEEEAQRQQPQMKVQAQMAPPPVRLGKNVEAPVAYQQQAMMQQQQQQWGAQEAYQAPMSMQRPNTRGEMRIPASPRAGGMMVPPSPRIGGGPMVPASPRVSAAVNQYAPRVPQSPRIAYNRMGGGGGMVVPQSPRVGGGMVPQSPRVSMGAPNGGYAPSNNGGGGYFQDRPMTSPAPMVHRSASVGMGTPQGNPLYSGSSTALGHSASFGGSMAPPMTPSAASQYGGGNASSVQGTFQGHNLPNMNAAEMYGGDITASGLSAVRGSLLTFQRAKNLQGKESVLRHLDSMVEHGRVSPDEVVAGIMEKCTEKLRSVPPPPRQSGGLLSNLAGKAKLRAAEDEFLKNPAVAEVGLLASTVVAFEWAPSSSFIELMETVPNLMVRRLLTLEFLNGVFGRCGKLAVAKVINELSYLDTLVGDGLLPSVRELSNCMVLVMVNTKRSVEWRRKWVLGKA